VPNLGLLLVGFHNKHDDNGAYSPLSQTTWTTVMLACGENNATEKGIRIKI
jgi:hypothetical protein